MHPMTTPLTMTTPIFTAPDSSAANPHQSLEVLLTAQQHERMLQLCADDAELAQIVKGAAEVFLATPQDVARANREYGDEYTEFDGNARMSPAEDGDWIQGWFFMEHLPDED